ncbi:unnamed protein product [Schistosoma rodhaini]|uniref:Serine incorporator 5 n=1 Tax=Schistosoma rodhaini TaxID=6188 RepID=A0AA85G2Q2_9TREM|nr:unnamed protein product [Schistosoma rodhaini]CAH8598096.1 unnamed protein product [Schistosoma rodhaini]
MGCLGRTLKCGFGAYPCFLCCVKNSRESTTTRLAYTLILVFITFMSIASHEGGVLSSLYLRHRDNFEQFCSQIGAGEGCYRIIGYIGVYRICLSLFTFHILMTFFTIAVSSSQTFRGKIHNGYWLWKVFFIVSLWFTAYFFPYLETLTRVWMIVGIVGGILFVYVQHITLIDFAYEINGNWHNKSKTSVFYTLAIYIVTLSLYAVAICAYTAFVLFYGLPRQCTLNLTVTGINGGLTLLFAICSAFSTILRKGQMWLPGAITSAFVAFLTWSALGSQPRILSSNFPWQKQTVKKMNDVQEERNLTIHPLVVVADQLNRLLSHQFTQTTNQVKTSPALPSKLKPNITDPIVLVNECLPGGVNKISEHLGKDIVTLLGITVVISGFLYSSFRASMQARRLGIRTRRERLKALLPPIHENSQFNESPLQASCNNKPTQSSNSVVTDNLNKSPIRFMNYKDVKRQEHALNLLADAVADLPNPKVFRRPSARQPRLNLQALNTSNVISQNIGNNVGNCRVKNKKDKLFASHNNDVADNNHNVTTSATPTTTNGKSTLRLASSEPDLTITMRNYSRQRGDIRDLDWSIINNDDNKNNKSSKHKTDKRSREHSLTSLNHRIGYLRHKKLKRSKSQLKSTNLSNDNKINDIHGNNSLLTFDDSEDNDNSMLKETKPSKLQFRKKIKKTWRGTCRLNSHEKRIVNDLYLFSADSLPEKVGPNVYLSVSPTTNNPIPMLANVARRSPLASKFHPQPLDLSFSQQQKQQHPSHDDIESSALTSPNHLRYRQARWASEIALNKRTSGLFNIEPGLVNSLSFLGTMLNTAAPRDGYTMYNEAIASVYSYPWFHFIYALATLYLMTQLTNWYNPQISRVDTLSESWANMWMKLASSWLALILYAWTIACPRLCIGRKLGAVPFTPRTPRAKISQTMPIV